MRNSIIFIVAMIAFGWIGWLIDGMPTTATETGLGMLLWILSPLIVSFLLRGFAKDGWSSLGWRPAFKGNGFVYTVSILFYPVALMVVLGLGQLFGAVNCPPVKPTPDQAIMLFLPMIIPQLIINVFEESGFRGYLTPKFLDRGMGRLTAHLAVGLVWGLWHLPYLRVILPYSGEGLITLVPRFLLGTMAVSIVYGELRRQGGSLWPAIVMQTVGGATIGTVLALKISVPKAAWLFMPMTEGGVMILFAAAVGFWLLGRKRPEGTEEEPEPDMSVEP